MTYNEAYEYANNNRKRILNTQGKTPVSKEFLAKAQEALIKQVPAERLFINEQGETEVPGWECPVCHNEYSIDYEDFCFCPNCGQAIERW